MDRLKQDGFLLESDQTLPSVCTLITGEPLKSSWWSHPKAQVIFQVNELLEDHADVMITKLVSGKVTFIHRKLWPAILAIGAAREPWQVEELSPPAIVLLRMVDEKGSLTTDKTEWNLSSPKLSDAARELERKLLVHSAQFHTDKGKHAKLLTSWKHWAAQAGLASKFITTAKAKAALEKKLGKLNEEFSAKGVLPWTKSTKRRNP